MNAHLLPHTVAGICLYMVVITKDDKLLPHKHYSGVLASSLDNAFDIAASHNAPLLEGGKELLQGGFQ